MVTKGHLNDTINSLHDDAMDPRMSVVGVGGAGCNIVSSLYDSEMEGLELVAINIDEDTLSRVKSDVKVLLDPPSHRNYGIKEAESAAESARNSLQSALSSDVIFLVCGLGGVTGSTVAPIVAEIGSDSGAVIIAIAVMPFAIEGRSWLANEGLRHLKERCHAVLVVDNNNLLSFEDLGFNEALIVVNRMIKTLIESVVQHLMSPYLLSFAEEVQMAARSLGGQETESVGVDVSTPSGIEVMQEFRPVEFDDKGFIGFA